MHVPSHPSRRSPYLPVSSLTLVLTLTTLPIPGLKAGLTLTLMLTSCGALCFPRRDMSGVQAGDLRGDYLGQDSLGRRYLFFPQFYDDCRVRSYQTNREGSGTGSRGLHEEESRSFVSLTPLELLCRVLTSTLDCHQPRGRSSARRGPGPSLVPRPVAVARCLGPKRPGPVRS